MKPGISLGDLCEIDVGPAFASRSFSEEPVGPRLLRGDNVAQGRLRWDGARFWPAELVPSYEKYELCEDDVILAMDRPWIEAGLKQAVVRAADLPALLVQRVARLRARPGVEQRFLRWLIAELRFTGYIRAVSTGSTVPHISQRQIADYPVVRLPDLAEQRAIAGVLGALDDKIESNRRLQATIAEIIEAEFAAVTVGKPDVPMALALKVEMGSPFSGDLFAPGGVGRPLIRIRDLKTFEPQTWTTEGREDEKIISPGDVLVGMDAEFRSTIWLGETGVLNQRVCRFRPLDDIGRAFALLAIRPELSFYEQAKSGTTVIHLNQADIARFRVPLLDEAAHVQLAEHTEPLIDRCVAAASESHSLAELRDALLPELLSGRLRVPVAEVLVEAAT